jgi:hypothetical protein
LLGILRSSPPLYPQKAMSKYRASEGIRIVTISLLACLAGIAVAADAGADLVLRNGRIYTVSGAQPTVEAVAIKDGRISAVGSVTAGRIADTEGRGSSM